MLIDVPGPAGVLQAMLSDSTTVDGRYAVLCHPHPQYGGDMNDSVLGILAGVLERNGVTCLRFNFRGTGASEGSHDGKGGEVDDVLATVAWLQAEHAPTKLILGGYSFGASMIWQALEKLDTPDRVLLIAPPVAPPFAKTDFASQETNCPVDVFAGDADQYVDPEALAAWQGISAHVIDGADHFFSGKWDSLEAEIAAVLG
jgi:alpha/beta superfamily hydrolase